MLIFLLGMMGCGKTTLGRQLAQQLGCPFVDLDEYIVRREHKTIASIFEEQGEEAFRQKERAALEAVVQEYPQAVVATGGGAPCFYDNINFMNLHGETIFLAVSPAEISRRLLATNLSLRPLLANKSEAEINSFITKTLSQRIRFYEQSKYSIAGSDITAVQLSELFNHN